MKSFTDVEQSKKLAKILPFKSADMTYTAIIEDYTYPQKIKEYKLTIKDECFNPRYDIPAWSLAALLEQLDDEITDEDGNDYNLTIIKEGLQYQLYYHDEWYQAEDIETEWYDNMIDACYEMIVKLKEKGLI